MQLSLFRRLSGCAVMLVALTICAGPLQAADEADTDSMTLPRHFMPSFGPATDLLKPGVSSPTSVLPVFKRSDLAGMRQVDEAKLQPSENRNWYDKSFRFDKEAAVSGTNFRDPRDLTPTHYPAEDGTVTVLQVLPSSPGILKLLVTTDPNRISGPKFDLFISRRVHGALATAEMLRRGLPDSFATILPPSQCALPQRRYGPGAESRYLLGILWRQGPGRGRSLGGHEIK